MVNLVTLVHSNFRDFLKAAFFTSLLLVAACGDASRSGGTTPKKTDGDPPSPTSLSMFVDILVEGAFEGIQTASKQDQDAFFAKNSKAAMTACITDKFKNDPKFELEKKWGDPAMDQYMGKLTDDNPIFEVIKKYGVKELNQQTKMAYDLWIGKAAESVLACVVQ